MVSNEFHESTLFNNGGTSKKVIQKNFIFISTKKLRALPCPRALILTSKKRIKANVARS
jgi:hypothetical protein